ncbi:MAG: linear amide C-N hydrolase [Firmicutes bacterium]|nr:linear amide C-N hydrolase [Bacillota bacterium]
MYHGRFKKSHYEAGYHWGNLLYQNGKVISDNHTFMITKEREEFAQACIPIYETYYPEILEEVKGLADGQRESHLSFYTFLFSMYCFEFDNHCTCFALKDKENILFGRNSDFLVSLEKLYMNVLYHLDNSYAFQGNTTAFIEMEDGMNEHGLAVGLTFIYPTITKPGFNAGMLVRYLLEKCKTTEEAITCLKKLPIASQQTLTIADRKGDLVVIECNSEMLEIIRPNQDGEFVTATNEFHSERMKKFNQSNMDTWHSEERYQVSYQALKENNHCDSLQLAKDILSGKYGFMCQYDRKMDMDMDMDADTVWSVIYDCKNKKVYRVEGNPSRKKFQEDTRMKCII